jgi:hypothetical protein
MKAAVAKSLAFTLFYLAACSSQSTTTGPATADKDPAAAKNDAKASGEEHDEHEGGEHHHEMDPDLSAFHDVLAPVFHMADGNDRNDKTCAAVPKMEELSGKVASSRKNDGARAAATELQESVLDLQKSCSSLDPASIKKSLEGLHTHFHEVMEKS